MKDVTAMIVGTTKETNGRNNTMGLDMYLYELTKVNQWRKANQIHCWFVRNIQDNNDDCDFYLIKKADIQKLYKTIEEVLEDNKLAKELLPVMDGFNFGSREYDEYYFAELKRTQCMLKDFLDNWDDKHIYVYQSEW